MNSLEKTFTVIEVVVSEQELGLSFSTIVARTGLPKASVHRILMIAYSERNIAHVIIRILQTRQSGSIPDLQTNRSGSASKSSANIGEYYR